MGVKSTKRLTREEAEEKYVGLYFDSEEWRRKIKAQAVVMGNEELEDILAKMNDSKYGGEGFENYWIV